MPERALALEDFMAKDSLVPGRSTLYFCTKAERLYFVGFGVDRRDFRARPKRKRTCAGKRYKAPRVRVVAQNEGGQKKQKKAEKKSASAAAR